MFSGILAVKVTFEPHHAGEETVNHTYFCGKCFKTEGMADAKVLRLREFGGTQEARVAGMEGVRKGGRGQGTER